MSVETPAFSPVRDLGEQVPYLELNRSALGFLFGKTLTCVGTSIFIRHSRVMSSSGICDSSAHTCHALLIPGAAPQILWTWTAPDAELQARPGCLWASGLVSLAHPLHEWEDPQQPHVEFPTGSSPRKV